MALSPQAKARLAFADTHDDADGDRESGRVMEEFDIDDVDDEEDEDGEGKGVGAQLRHQLFEGEDDDKGEEEEEEEEEDDDISRAAAATAFLDNEVEKKT